MNLRKENKTSNQNGVILIDKVLIVKTKNEQLLVTGTLFRSGTMEKQNIALRIIGSSTETILP